jgi:molecular chaperone GrpE
MNNENYPDNMSTASGQASPEQPGPTAPPESERVAQLETEVAQYKDQALRALAEAENTRRRAQREIEDNSKYAVANIARDVLGVADNLRRALDAIPPEARVADDKLEKFAAGVELTERELLSAFERHGIKRVDPLGQPFDHNFHQAVMQVDTSDQPANTVVQVLQPGYTIHGRLLRPAMVAVSKGQAAAPPGAKVDTTV